MPFISEAHRQSLGEREHAQLLAAHLPFGTHPGTGDTLFTTDKDRYAGTYVQGVQGVGKSGLLENLIAYDILLDNAVIGIDPHGDLTHHCLAQLPDEKLSKTYVFNLEDEAYPFGINLFASHKLNTSIAQAQAVDRVMHVFEVLWPDVLGQQHLPRFVRAATIALFANPGSTLVDMHKFLLDDKMRHEMLKNVTDPTVTQFWQSQYDDLSMSARLQRVEPLIGRLESLFMGRSLVRNIVGQRETSIDFRKAIENKEIIFIKLPIKTLAQDARLIGTLLIAQLHAAIFSFSNIPEHERPGFSLYVDEVQHFATSDFGEMFTEGRKFGVRVTVAHQYRNQLPGYLQDSTMTARTKVIFQTTPDDARELAHLFPGGEAAVHPEDIDPHPVAHLLAYGSEDPKVETFIDTYLRSLQTQKRGGGVEITRPGFRAEHIGFWVMNVKPPTDNPRVPDPTQYLDHLLYEAMRTGDPYLDIPGQVVYGFANCGRGFFPEFRYSLKKGQLLSAGIKYPPALVVETANGTRWTRRPENGAEQLYHFIYHLRELMKCLASNPIGKKSTLSTTEVAQMLTQLPRRAAFVRSGEEMGVIYTDDTLPMVSGSTFAQRLEFIQAQTRQKYCRPKSEVEKEPEAKTEAGTSSWEVIE